MYDCIYNIWIYANICKDMANTGKKNVIVRFFSFLFSGFFGKSLRELTEFRFLLEHRWWNDQLSTICDQTWISGGDMRFSIQTVTVSRKSPGIFGACKSVKSTQPAIFCSGSKPSAETTGRNHQVLRKSPWSRFGLRCIRSSTCILDAAMERF